MALSAATVWECRVSGSDANGGGFAAGSGGTDYSQQDAAQVAYTDLVIGANNTQLTSAANPFASAHVGNLVNVTGGTGFTPGRYQVVSVAGGVATLDRAVGTAASTGGTGNLGGALATLGGLASGIVNSNKVFLKSGTYNLTAGLTLPNVSNCTLVGYAATRGDISPNTANLASRPQVLANAAAITNLVTIPGNGWVIQNLAFGAGSNVPGTALNLAGYAAVANCKISGFSTCGLNGTYYGYGIFACEVTGGVAGATSAINITNAATLISHCWVHDNACTGIVAIASTIEFCVIARNTGATSDGIFVNYNTMIVRNCTIWKNGRHGIYAWASTWATQFLGNILAENGGFGLTSLGSMPSLPMWDGNAYYLNASGTRSPGMSDTSGSNAVTPYVNTHDAILTADPFVNKAGNDFRLNATPGGGAACRAAAPGYPGFGSPSAPYLDMGAIQHADSGGISKSRLIAGL